MQEANVKLALQREAIESSNSLHRVLQSARQEAVAAYRQLHMHAAQESEAQDAKIQVPCCPLCCTTLCLSHCFVTASMRVCMSRHVLLTSSRVPSAQHI